MPQKRRKCLPLGHESITRYVLRSSGVVSLTTISRRSPRIRGIVRVTTRSGGEDAVTGSAAGDERSTSWLRALAVLEILGEPTGAGGMGVVELARRLGRDKSQVARMLRALAVAGYVEREPRSARYRLGTRLFALAAHAVDERLRDEADVLVERESARIGERVEVAIRSGGFALTLATAAPHVELRAQGWGGR